MYKSNPNADNAMPRLVSLTPVHTNAGSLYSQRFLNTVPVPICSPKRTTASWSLVQTADKVPPYKGSSNQRFINLTKRYIDVDPSITSNRIEMRVLPNGVIETCGFATVEKLQEIGQVLSVKPKRLYRLD